MAKVVLSLPIRRTSDNVLYVNTSPQLEVFRTATYATAAGSSAISLPVAECGGISVGDSVYVGTNAAAVVSGVSATSGAGNLTIPAASWSNNDAVVVKRKTGSAQDAYTTIYDDPDFVTSILLPYTANTDNEWMFYIKPGRHGVRYSDSSGNTLQLDSEICFDELDFVQATPLHDSNTGGIREAVNKVSSTGGTVFLTPGDYTFSTGVSYSITRSNLTIKGSPKARIKATDATQDNLLSIGAGATNVKLIDVEFGTAQAGGTTGTIVEVTGATDIDIIGCKFDNVGSPAIDVTQASQRVRILNNTIRTARGHAIILSSYVSASDPTDGADYILVDGNMIYNPQNSGMSIEVLNLYAKITNNFIVGANQVKAADSPGIGLINGCDYFDISNNTIVGTLPKVSTNNEGNGIVVSGGELADIPLRGRIVNNTLVSNGHDGAGDNQGNGIFINCAAVGATVVDIVIANNTIDDSGRRGISIASAEGVVISGNDIRGSKNEGIIIDINSPRNTVSGNRVSTSSNNGICVNSAQNTIVGNTVSDNASSGINVGSNVGGIALTSDYNMVLGNVCKGNDTGAIGAAGIWISGDATDGSSNNMIAYNVCSDDATATQDYGIKIQHSNCSGNYVIGNALTANTVSALSDVGGSTRVRNNIGYSTEAVGSATITTGNTSVVITHSLDFTPTADDIMVVPSNNPTNDPGNFYIDTFTATQFTLHVRNDPGASGATFSWRARYN